MKTSSRPHPRNANPSAFSSRRCRDGQHARRQRAAGRVWRIDQRKYRNRCSDASVKRGGTLTIGITAGSPTDNLDPNAQAVTGPTTGRILQLFESLVSATPDARPRFDLATAITPNATATQWTIHIRPGVTFHNGKDLTADDVFHVAPHTRSQGAPARRPLARASDLFPRLQSWTA